MKRLGLILMVAAMGMPGWPGVSRANETVYRNVLPGVVWIWADLSDHHHSYGTGVVVDTVHRQVLTNAHVVGEAETVSVLFPQKSQGRLIAERDFYRSHFDHLAVAGKVIYRSYQTDLAVIKLEAMPAQARAIPLATEEVSPGQRLHAVGNPAKMDALWVYTSGHVRQTYAKRWRAQTNAGKTVLLRARVVETSVAINPGDSGAPVVNDRGELVALVASYDRNAELVSTCIAVVEIRRVLAKVWSGVYSHLSQSDMQRHKSLYAPPEYLPDVSPRELRKNRR